MSKGEIFGLGPIGHVIHDIQAGYVDQKNIAGVITRLDDFEDSSDYLKKKKLRHCIRDLKGPTKSDFLKNYYDLKNANLVIQPRERATDKFIFHLDYSISNSNRAWWIDDQGAFYFFGDKGKKWTCENKAGIDTFYNLQALKETYMDYKNAGNCIFDLFGYTTPKQKILSENMQGCVTKLNHFWIYNG
jgi:hypothetical protein